MPFDMIVPARNGRRVAGSDKVHLLLAKAGKHKTLEMRVSIGGDVATVLGWVKGQRVHLGVGRAASAEQGQFAIWPAEDGHFRLQASGRKLFLVTRSLHPALSLVAYPSTEAKLVQTAPDRLVVRLPPCALAPAPVGDIMGDQYRKRAG